MADDEKTDPAVMDHQDFLDASDCLFPLGDPIAGICEALGHNDKPLNTRTMQRYQSGKNALPVWMKAKMLELLRSRRDDIDNVIARIEQS